MVFAVNCGLDGSPNSFTNFKQAALAFGAAQSSAAPEATPDVSTATAVGGGDAASAANGAYTIPAAPGATPATQTPSSPDPTPAAGEGTIHIVKVGGPGIVAFNPSNIQALPGDRVVFQL